MQQNRSRGGGGKGFWILYKEKDAKNKLPNGCSCFQMGKVSVYCKNSACPLRQHRSSSRRVAAAAHFQIASKNSASTLLLLLAKLQLLPNACQASKALKAFFLKANRRFWLISKKGWTDVRPIFRISFAATYKASFHFLYLFWTNEHWNSSWISNGTKDTSNGEVASKATLCCF